MINYIKELGVEEGEEPIKDEQPLYSSLSFSFLFCYVLYLVLNRFNKQCLLAFVFIGFDLICFDLFCFTRAKCCLQ
jgi:uncharacterized membrane protein (DUF485 family)